MTLNICAMPLWLSPTSHPIAGIPCCPKVSSQVAETFRPILCSSPVTNTPLRSPGSPVSGSSRNLGTTNRLRPLVPGPAPSGRASVRCRMFSKTSSLSPLVMNRLTPSMCQVPSPWSTALVRPAPTSEPASGSVSTIVAPQLRSIAIDGPVPLLLIADAVEDVRHKRSGQEHEHRGVGAEHQLVDRPLHDRRRRHTADVFVEPDPEPLAFRHAPQRLLERLGQGDDVGVGIECRRVAVTLGERLGHRAFGQSGRLGEHLPYRVAVEVAERVVGEHLHPTSAIRTG